MSFPGRGRSGRRGRRAGFGVFAGALFVWQALTLIGAAPALAAATGVCTVSGSTVTVSPAVAGDTLSAVVSQGTGAQAGQIVVGASSCSPVAIVATTTIIQVNGSTGNDTLTIRMFNTDGKISWGTIDWTVNLGSDTGTAPYDRLTVDNSGATAGALDLTMGASGIDLNTDGNLDVVSTGVDAWFVNGGPKDDTISAAGDATTGAAFPSKVTETGGDGADTLTGGAGSDSINGGRDADVVAGGLGDDSLDGGIGDSGCSNTSVCLDEDAVDYSGSTAAVTVNLNTGNATGQGLDTISNMEDIVGSPQSDTLTGGGLTAANGNGADNFITPGAGDDKVDGLAGEDEVDYSDATAAVTVDLTKGTATGGGGNDTLTNIEDAAGSDFNDTLTGTSASNFIQGGDGNDMLAGMGGNDELRGEGGLDTVDYSWSSKSVALKLNCGTTNGQGLIVGGSAPTNDVIKTMENGQLTTGDDSFIGNEFANTVWPNGGSNSLNGDCSTPTESGGDAVNYSVGYDAAVTVNLAGGGAGTDAVIGFENVTGTSFADSITGNEVSNTILADGGNDTIRGGGGDDTLKGAKGNDTIRGGGGDDDMFGGKGKKDAGYGGGGTDLCKGFEFKKGCELH